MDHFLLGSKANHGMQSDVPIGLTLTRGCDHSTESSVLRT
jgi:hypothetical protein